MCRLRRAASSCRPSPSLYRLSPCCPLPSPCCRLSPSSCRISPCCPLPLLCLHRAASWCRPLPSFCRVVVPLVAVLTPIAVVVPHVAVLPLAVVVPPVAVVVPRRRVARRLRFAVSSCRLLLCCLLPSLCRPSPCCPVPSLCRPLSCRPSPSPSLCRVVVSPVAFVLPCRRAACRFAAYCRHCAARRCSAPCRRPDERHVNELYRRAHD